MATISSALAGTEVDIAMLQRLAILGMRMAELIVEKTAREHAPSEQAVEAQAATPAPRPKGDDPGLPFNRIARTIRDTIALKNRIAGVLTAKNTRPKPKADEPATETVAEYTAGGRSAAEICDALGIDPTLTELPNTGPQHRTGPSSGRDDLSFISRAKSPP